MVTRSEFNYARFSVEWDDLRLLKIISARMPQGCYVSRNSRKRARKINVATHSRFQKRGRAHNSFATFARRNKCQAFLNDWADLEEEEKSGELF